MFPLSLYKTIYLKFNNVSLKLLENKFRSYMGTLLRIGPFHTHEDIDSREIKQEIILRQALLARYTSDIQYIIGGGKIDVPDGFPLEWWYCICDTAPYLPDLTAKQRYRVNKGLKNNEIWIANQQDVDQYWNSIVKVAVESLAEYPSVYRQSVNQKALYKEFCYGIESDRCDVWLAKNTETGEISAYAFCYEEFGMEHLSKLKAAPKYLKSEINAALAYEITRYYLADCNRLYVQDGERNIRHITNYQDFLVKTLNYRYVYCKLNLVYHPLVKPIISILYPLRRLLKNISMKSRLIYNVYCVLRQEEIARKFR